MIKILMLEDLASDAELIKIELKNAELDFIAERVDNKYDFAAKLNDFEPDIILADYNLPQWTAIDALKYLNQNNILIPLILVTGTQTEEVAVECMKLGAEDYLLKTSLVRLSNAITNAVSKKDIEKEKQKAEESFLKEFYFRKVIEESIPAGVATIDLNMDQNYVNNAFCEMVGYSKEELLFKKPPFIYWPEDQTKFFMNELNSLKNDEIHSYESEGKFLTKEGNIIDVSITISPLKASDKKLIGWVGVVYDISDRKRAEKEREESLKEKQVLLKEVHHRVKNNLQIISSLFNLQSDYIKDKEDLEIFFKSQKRIKSMALVHEKLYQSKYVSQIDFSSYLKDLAKNMFSLNGISLTYNIVDVYLSIDNAVPLGLILVELISNSIRHAFVPAEAGMYFGNKKIDISLLKVSDIDFVLAIKDNGRGIPENVDFQNTDTLGFQLVTTLVEQINGKIKLNKKEGTEILITFQESGKLIKK